MGGSSSFDGIGLDHTERVARQRAPYRIVRWRRLVSLHNGSNRLRDFLEVLLAARTILSLTNEETTPLKLLLAKCLDSTTSILVCHVGKAESA